MMVPRYFVRHVALGTALAAMLIVGCGGVKVSDRDRRAKDGTEDGGDTEEVDAARPPTTTEPPVVDPPIVAPPDAAVDAPEPIPAGSYGAGTFVKVATTSGGPLNLRDAPNGAAAVVASMPNGTRVKVEKTSGADGWVNLAYDAKIGFASKTFLTPVP